MISFIKKFSQKHVILFAIIVTCMTLIISALFIWDTNPFTGLDKLVGDILITLSCLLLINTIGIGQTAGFQKEGLVKGMVYGIPFVIIGICAAVIGNRGVNLGQLQPVPIAGMFLFTLNMFFVGVNEEVSMRSLILNNLVLKYGRDRKGIYKAILISSMIFGAMHLVNGFFIAPVTVIFQTINAASAGVLFAAIYICSKNIWASIVIHALVDWLALFIGQCFIGGESVLSGDMTIAQALMMIPLGAIPPLICAIVLLERKYFRIKNKSK